METPQGWLTIEEVMARLHVSRDTVYRLARNYGWEAWQPGPRRRFWSARSVDATPDARERRREGWRKRRSHPGAFAHPA